MVALSRPLHVSSSQEIEELFGITYLDSLEFISEEVIDQIKRKAKRKLWWNRHRKANRWVCSLYEKELLERREIPFLIKKVNPMVGYGVYATKTIQHLSFIGEYTGFVRRRNRRADNDNDYVFGYVIGPQDTQWIIDAREKGNFTRFINHSYEPNVTSRWIISGGVGHVIFYANRRIEAGEQLTYDYGPYYWKKRSFPQSL